MAQAMVPPMPAKKKHEGPFFVRVGSKPQSDLRRGYSYPMGSFGDESQAHAGLSGYEVDDALSAATKLQDRMGIWGSTDDYFVTLFAGAHRGVGPDGEDLFKPIAIVKSWTLRQIGEDDKSNRVKAIFHLARLMTHEIRRHNPALAEEWQAEIDEMAPEFPNELA